MKNTLVHNRYSLAIAFFLMILLVSCNIDDQQKLDNHNWQLSWNDEFDGTAGTLPDATKWVFDIGTGNNGWGNNELEYYTNRPENISKDGKGNLVITAIKESYQGSSYTSARIKTIGLLEQQYGRFEARIKTPYGQGLWPAFWMLGNNVATATWPLCGEIDIMELKGQAPSSMSSALHGPGYSGANPILSPYTLINDRFDTDFHVFAAEWDENKIDFFVDGYLFKRVSKSDVEAKGKWVYDHPFFLILNLAVGGDFVGPPNSQSTFPQKMTIDYVRVYK
jgi:beta-glucanase (GH16 family)